jgi:hypothetical protein
MRRSSGFLGSLVVVVACQAPGDAKKGETGGAASTAGKAVNPNAAGDEPAPVSAITECPKSLGGPEKQHRVISRDCGVVQVTDDLAIDGGSLTLEAGAQLAFKDGAGITVGYYEPAKLIIKGTAEDPVVFTSAGDKSPGVWRGVLLHANASRSKIAGLVIEYAGAGDAAALQVMAPDVTLEGSTIRESKAGVRVEGDGGFAAFSGNEFKKLGQPAAITAPPGAIGGLGTGNRFDGGAFVQVVGGSVRKSAKWQLVGAPLVFAEEVGIDGENGQKTTVELAPGIELKFAADGMLNVGYYEGAALVARGSAEAPITFTAHERRAPGGWRGIRVHGQGEATFERAVLEFGGRDDQGTIDVLGGTLSLTSTTLRSDKVGVVADVNAKITAFADNTFVATPIAVQVPVGQIGSLGEGNAYDKDAKIKASGEQVKGKQTWHVQGVPIELSGGVGVEGELTLDAGVALLAGADTEITVGQFGPATLIARGTAAAPVTIGPADAVKGTWLGVVLHTTSTGNMFEHLVLTGVEHANAIDVKARTNAKLSNVTCSRCAGAVVGWECGATVTSSQVLAADGTPRIDARPDGC